MQPYKPHDSWVNDCAKLSQGVYLDSYLCSVTLPDSGHSLDTISPTMSSHYTPYVRIHIDTSHFQLAGKLNGQQKQDFNLQFYM